MAGEFAISPTLGAVYGTNDADKGALKLVTGTQAVTTTAAVTTGLSEIIAGGATSQTTPAATNDAHTATFSGGVLTLACFESDYTVGTTAATLTWWALGYESPAL